MTKQSIHDLIWFSFLIGGLFIVGLNLPLLKDTSVLFFSCLFCHFLLLFLKIIHIFRNGSIPIFNVHSQIIVVLLFVTLFQEYHRLTYIEVHSVPDNTFFDLQRNSLESYNSFPHAVYNWDEIKSSYIQKEYKQFAQLHQDFYNPTTLLLEVYQLNISKKLTDNDIKYLKELLVLVDSEDFNQFKYHYLVLEKDLKDFKKLLKIIAPSVVTDE